LSRNNENTLSIYYRVVDILGLNVAFFLGICIRFYASRLFGLDEKLMFSFVENEYTSLLLLMNVTWLFISNSQNIYDLHSFSSKNRYLFALITTILLQFLISIGFNGLIKTYYSRLFIFWTYLCFIIVFFIGRKLSSWVVQRNISKNTKHNSIVLLGRKSLFNEISEFLKNNISTGKQQIFELEVDEDYFKNLKKINEESPISEIYIPISLFNEDEIEAISNFCDNRFIRLRLIFDWKKVGSKNLRLGHFNQVSVLKVSITPLDDQYNALVKRVFDLSISIVAVIFVFSWLFPIIALAIKVSSKGPVFFRQKRSGQKSKEFYCYKFRSMKENKDADILQATMNDSRITAIGKFLRRSSLDELPQFINVIKGEMSIVGPRPHMLKHTKEYSNLVGSFMNRHAIKPGITGLAQIKGYRGEIRDLFLLQNRVRLDRFYVNNWTMFFDVRIMVITLLTLFRKHN
jgi:Undecaprenyl-phosphate glucose phosphotransferase